MSKSLTVQSLLPDANTSALGWNSTAVTSWEKKIHYTVHKLTNKEKSARWLWAQKLQQQQENLYPRRKCMLKRVLKGRTINVSKSYFFLNAQLFTKEVWESCQKGSFPRVGSCSILRILQLEERTCNLVNHNNALYTFKFPSPMLIAT